MSHYRLRSHARSHEGHVKPVHSLGRSSALLESEDEEEYGLDEHQYGTYPDGSYYISKADKYENGRLHPQSNQLKDQADLMFGRFLRRMKNRSLNVVRRPSHTARIVILMLIATSLL